MMELVVAVVVGARPQFIKAAALSRAIAERADKGLRPVIKQVLIHTGQHYDYQMSDIFFLDQGLPAPTQHLGVGSGAHGEQTGEIMKRLEPVLGDLSPDVVIVVGDTNSTLAAALCAAKLKIPIAHVEAGLRSFNRTMPEEINRKLVDHVSDLLLCPSAHAASNLKSEGITMGVHVTGDVMLESLIWAQSDPDEVEEVLDHYGLTSGAYAVATVHRAENTDDPARFAEIISALEALAVSGLSVILPVHPRTAPLLHGRAVPPSLKLIDPVGHSEMLALATASRIGLTDSGGLQKELYWLGIPCVTMRDETEWVETVEAGWNILAGASAESITNAAQKLLEHTPTERPPIYGTGDASDRIIGILIDRYGKAQEH